MNTPVWRAMVVFGVLGLLAYYNSLSAAFIFDDLYFVRLDQLKNPLACEMIQNRPVIALTLSANFYADGLNPRGYHFLNLIVHILAATTLFDLVRRILLLNGRDAARAEGLAYAIALLWMLHPLQTQAVTYMIQRCESMMGMFYLLSLWGLVRFHETNHQNRWLAISYLAAVLSCGCKEVAVTIPVVAALLDRAYLSSSWRELLARRWGYYLGLFVLNSGCIYLTVFAKGAIFTGAGAAGFGVGLYTPFTYALTQSEAIFYYLKLSFWPSPLCLDYIDWPVVKSLAQGWRTAIPLAAIVLASCILTLIRPRWGFLPLTFFVILAPTSSIVPIQDALFEHRMYLSLAPLIAGVVLLVERGLQKVQEHNAEAALGLTRLTGVIFVVVLVIFTFRCILRNGDYASMLRMYTDVVAKRPGNFRGHSNLGWALLGAGNYQAAKLHAEKALSYQPGNPNYLHGMAAAQFDNGDPDGAWKTIQSVKNFPEAARITWELPLTAAKVLVVLNRPAEALAYLDVSRQVLAQDARNDLFTGMAYWEMGRIDDARQSFKTLLKRVKNYDVELNSLARNTAFIPRPNRTQIRIARLSAEAACLMTDHQNFEYLDTLAIVMAMEARLLEVAPQAEAAIAGMWRAKPVPQAFSLFEQAAKLEEQAIKLAESQGKTYRAERLRERQKLFAKQQRYLGS